MHGLRQSEVHDDDAAGRVAHDVAGFQVAMDDAFGVRRLQSRTRLRDDVNRFFRGELSFLGKNRAQVLTFDELHGDELHAFGFAEVVDADDVPVRDLSRQDQFLFEARQNCRIAREVWPYDLQAQCTVDFQIVRLVDRAHAAHAQQFLDLVAAAQHAAHLEDRRPNRGINLLRHARTGIAVALGFHHGHIVGRITLGRGRWRLCGNRGDGAVGKRRFQIGAAGWLTRGLQGRLRLRGRTLPA